ncbi:MAG: sensor histidine kinase [Spirochaetales bacterium]|nr:sensor histidine kinase [Spirochaetales bacterium]MCF7938511.1 sensor histidine kinase [Spirochaetales bacterium]
MALVHENLYQSEYLSKVNMKEYIETLSRELLSLYRQDGKVALDVGAEEIEIDIKKALPCGIIINELITNSLKHAFPAEAEGAIAVLFRKNSGNTIELTVRDNGVGIPEETAPVLEKHLGFRLIYLLSDQIGGELSAGPTDPVQEGGQIFGDRPGTEFKLLFPGE